MFGIALLPSVVDMATDDGSRSLSAEAGRTETGFFGRWVVARPLDDILIVVVVMFRIFAWAWMMSLIAATLLTDDQASRPWVWTAALVATVWTGVTVWAGAQRLILLKGFAVADLAVALFLASAPGWAGSIDLFYGGMPLSSLFVAALAGGFSWVLTASVLIGLTQLSGLWWWNREVTAVQAIGLVLVFVVPAIVIGWAFDTLRATDRLRRAAEGDAAEERARRIREEERLEVADQLHDSVLQTLSIIEGRTEEPETRHAARRERRNLRSYIDGLRYGPERGSVRTRMRDLAEEVEDVFLISVETIVVGNAPMDGSLDCLCGAAHEALVNAAKYSGSGKLSLYAQVHSDRVSASVKDDGVGIDDQHLRESLEAGLTRRMAACGGVATIVSEPGVLTIVELSVPRRTT